MALELSIVEFDDIYEALLENDAPMSDENVCMEYLNTADNPHASKWMSLASANSKILSDIKTIINYYLEENGE